MRRTTSIVLTILSLSCFTYGALASDLPQDYDRLRETRSASYGRLSGAQLNGWILVGSNLEGADLTNADLRGANLRRANLKDAKLAGAELYGADLREAQGVEDLIGIGIELLKAPGRIHLLKQYNLDLLEYGKNDLQFFHQESKKRSNVRYAPPVCQFALGFLNEIYGDAKAAFTFYQSSAKGGVIEALNNLGWMYEAGFGVEHSLSQAKDMYEKASVHPMATFNLCRFEAMYEDNPVAQDTLSRMYEDGPLKVKYNRNYVQAAYWAEKAASRNHKDSQYRLGIYYKQGLGVPQCLEIAFDWIKRAAENNHLRAQMVLGEMYEHGQGTGKDLTQALFWYTQAGEQDYKSALGKVGDFYAKGYGTEANPQEALKWYLRWAAQGSITAHYNAGMMYEQLEQYEDAFKEYEEAIELTAQEGTSHVGAIFRLASLYERGKGAQRDPLKANALYEHVARRGHHGAKIKLGLIRSEVREIADFLTTIRANEITPFAEATHQWLESELAKDYRISDYAQTCLYVLLEDYTQAMQKVQALKHEDMSPLRVNYSQVLEDPYLHPFLSLLGQEPITDAEITTAAFQVIYNELFNAYKDHPSYTPELAEDLIDVFNRFYARGQASLRKAFLRLYTKLLTDEGRVEVPQGMVDEDQVKKYRQGHIAASLLQNNERCPDGMGQFINDEAWKLMAGAQEGIPLGFLISRLITEHKYEFLKLHRNPIPEAYEEATEATRLLEERIRLPLGLPQNFVMPLYPSMGKGEDKKYRPTRVISRFFKGDTLRFKRLDQRQDVIIPAFNTEFLTNLLVKGYTDKVIKDATLTEFAQRDPLSKQKLDEAFIEFEENDYFNPDAAQGSPFKKAFFQRVLEVYGYITK